MPNGEYGERVARLEAEVRGLREAVTTLHVRIEGPPRKDSISGRMHTLESSEAAAKAAEAALVAAHAVSSQSFSRRQKIAGLVLGLLTTGAAVGAFVLALISAT